AEGRPLPVHLHHEVALGGLEGHLEDLGGLLVELLRFEQGGIHLGRGSRLLFGLLLLLGRLLLLGGRRRLLLLPLATGERECGQECEEQGVAHDVDLRGWCEKRAYDRSHATLRSSATRRKE